VGSAPSFSGPEGGVIVGGKGARKRFETPMCKRIGIPRAAVTADEIGEVAVFLSFGTNDLT
jgi:phosphoenolpyruvate synthase/pyruvate phosphate dikinase